MLDFETKAKLLNAAMQAENLGYSKECMDCIIGGNNDDNKYLKDEILDYWRTGCRLTFQLYCEIMKRTPSTSNEISFKIK